MRNRLALVLSGLVAGAMAYAQSPQSLDVCELGDYCYLLSAIVMGGVRFEDYKVTHPEAVQFDPELRRKELAAMGPTAANAFCKAPPAFTTPAPTITFDKNSVEAQIYWITSATNFSPSEFMDVQFSNLVASNGYTSPRFGFRMVRVVTSNGVETPGFQIQVQAGNRGLENVGIPANSGVGFGVDPVTRFAAPFGTVPPSELLRQAILGVFLNAQSILSAAKFTVTAGAPPGKPLWSGAELISLAAQAQPLITAGTGTTIPVSAPISCLPSVGGYTVCNGTMGLLENAVLLWGGEYLALRTRQSYDVLVSNLLPWAQAKAPVLDPAYAATGVTLWKPPLSYPLLMLWPTLRADPALSATDRETIGDWIHSLVSPRQPRGWYANDLGYFAESVNMAEAIAHSDDTGFAYGIAQFYGALHQMRADGSFPLAAQLSACSAVYSNTDLISLVTIAEMAATQGYDLYSMRVDGKTLDTAIKFMLDAFENPDLLYQYSKAGGGVCFEGNAGDPPDFNGYRHPDGSLAWMEAYIARFPLSSTAARLRKILGSNASAPPFPLMNTRMGLNATCAFRKMYESQPVNGARVAIGGGDGQIVGANQRAPTPLTVRVTDNSGKALPGVQVSFAVREGSASIVAPAQVVSDAAGMASALVTMGSASGPVAVTATAMGVSAKFSLDIPGPSVLPGGVQLFGGSVSGVTTLSPGAVFSVFGKNFVPEGTGRGANSDEVLNGILPSTLLGICVSVGGLFAPILDVYTESIDAVVPDVPLDSGVAVIVTSGCGTADARQSMPLVVKVAIASPQFLYYADNADGLNPVKAVNLESGQLVGLAELGPEFTPALPGDRVTIYATGLGPTDPRVVPGSAPSRRAPVTSPVTVKLGSVTLDPNDVIFVGAVPGEVTSRVEIRIPLEIPSGNQPIQIEVAGVASPAGGFLAIRSQ